MVAREYWRVTVAWALVVHGTFGLGRGNPKTTSVRVNSNYCEHNIEGCLAGDSLQIVKECPLEFITQAHQCRWSP
jgi:hypothetical protein